MISSWCYNSLQFSNHVFPDQFLICVCVCMYIFAMNNVQREGGLFLTSLVSLGEHSMPAPKMNVSLMVTLELLMQIT